MPKVQTKCQKTKNLRNCPPPPPYKLTNPWPEGEPTFPPVLAGGGPYLLARALGKEAGPTKLVGNRRTPPYLAGPIQKCR